MPLSIVTKAEYDKLPAQSQGYLQYWQGDQPGSELKGLKNPYPQGSLYHEEWNLGQRLAMLDAQDSEE